MSRVKRESRDAAKRVVAEIVRTAGTVYGRVRLYKAFYAAHLFFWQKHSMPLTDYPIVHMPLGPGIDEGDELLAEMEAEGTLKISSRANGPYREDVFKLVRGPVVRADSHELEAVKKAVEWVKGKSATQLSSDTHEHSRSWNATQVGAEMNVYLDALSEAEYERLRFRAAAARELVSAALSKA